MRITVTICILFLFTPVFSLPVTERKKHLEKRLKMANDAVEAFSASQLTENLSQVKESMGKMEEAFSLNDTKAGTALLEKTEKLLHKSEKEISAMLEQQAKKLIEIFSSAKDEKEVHPGEKPVVSSSAKEKIVKYFQMAKAEYASAEKYSRERKYYYTLYIYKRSIRYSIEGIRETGNTIAPEFKNAEKWTKTESHKN